MIKVKSSAKKTTKTDRSPVFGQIYNEILTKNEIKANLLFSKIVLVTVLAYMAVQLSGQNKAGMRIDVVSSIMFFICTCFSLTSVAGCFFFDGKGFALKYALLLSVLFIAFSSTLYSVYGYIIFFALPIIASLIYSEIFITAVISAATYIMFIIYVAVSPYYGLSVDYFDLSNIIIPEGTLIKITGTLSETLENSGYITDAVILSTQVSTLIAGSFALLVIIAIAVIIALNNSKVLKESAQSIEKQLENERKIAKANEKIILSQLRPHFLYNSLTAIMAIDGNPPETMNAIASFAKYLRTNLNSLEDDSLIPFSKELSHIEHYLALEKLRFEDKIKVVKDIKDEDFMLPPLCVQMAVENAVKHGISKKPEGGTLTLMSYANEKNHIIKVADNGCGFDMKAYNENSDKHIGIKSMVSRIENAGGSVDIASAPGEGTVITFTIPKE